MIKREWLRARLGGGVIGDGWFARVPEKEIFASRPSVFEEKFEKGMA